MLVTLPVLVALVAFVVAAAVGARRGAAAPPPGRLGDVARATRRWRAVGLLAGVALAALSLQQGALGRGVLLAAPLLGLCVLGGVVVGELRVRAPGGPTRSAVLEVRRPLDYVPRVLGALVAAAAVLLLGVLAVTTALGSADDLGRAGRALARVCAPDVLQRSGPWPGSFYAVPLLLVVLAGLLGAAVALRRVVVRPRQGEDPAVDDALRRHAATAVVAAVGLLVTVPFSGIAAVAAPRLLTACDPPLWWSALGVGLAVVSPLLVALGSWCAAQLLLPSGVAPVQARG